ncbi:MAG: Type 1 glutamine amidotransferase-like domain-containing protein [Candidatus Pacebacteria bacterium]|nr:Type 1 glutamine amidotransferase-like domain-containing protein [Candidatus Paceibacterota bacterium]
MKNINLYISGGGGAQDSLLLDKHFLNKIDKKKGVLYIPIAMEVDKIGFESCYDWIIETLSNISEGFIDVTMWTDLYSKTWDDIKDFGAIYIGGGNTFKLLNYLLKTGFAQLLKKFITNGGVVYGGSAGAIIMGRSINTVIEENDKNYTESRGLDLFFGHSIICHYNNEIDNKIINYIQTDNNKVIALPEKTGLHLVNSEILVIGYEPAYYFNLKGEIKILRVNIKYYYDEEKKEICNL